MVVISRPAVSIDKVMQASVGVLSIHTVQSGTRAAIADDFGSGQTDVVAQGLCQSVTGLDDHGVFMAIDTQFYRQRVWTDDPVSLQSLFGIVGESVSLRPHRRGRRESA